MDMTNAFEHGAAKSYDDLSPTLLDTFANKFLADAHEGEAETHEDLYLGDGINGLPGIDPGLDSFNCDPALFLNATSSVEANRNIRIACNSDGVCAERGLKPAQRSNDTLARLASIRRAGVRAFRSVRSEPTQKYIEVWIDDILSEAKYQGAGEDTNVSAVGPLS